MKTRPLAIVTICIAMFLGLFVLWAHFDREPEYEGRPLSYWLDQNSTGEFENGIDKTLKALKTIGAPAAGPLVDELAYNDSTFRRYYTGLRSWLPAAVKAVLPRQKMDAPNVRNNAFSALCYIQSDAREQVPELIQLLSHGDKEVRVYATLVLGLIGPDSKPAVPFLEGIANDPGLSNYVSEASDRLRKEVKPVNLETKTTTANLPNQASRLTWIPLALHPGRCSSRSMTRIDS